VEDYAVCSAAEASHNPGRYPGWFGLYVEALPGKDRADVVETLMMELKKLRDEPPSEEELKRVKQQLLASAVFGRESTNGLARSIVEAVLLNDLAFAKRTLPDLLAVTAADVQRVAKKYLGEDRALVIWSVPDEKKGAGSKHLNTIQETVLTARQTIGSRLSFVSRAGDASAKGTIDLKTTRRVELPSGMVVLLYPNRRVPTFEAHVQLREGALFQSEDKLGVATLSGLLLDEGTPTRSGPKIADIIEGLGGELNLSGVGGSVKVLAPDRKIGLELLFDCLINPVMPEDAFKRAKARLLSQVMENEAQPETKAEQAFQSLVYGKHPLGRPIAGTMTTVKGLSREDCRAFHSLVFRPNNLVVVFVGDFDPDAVLKELQTLTAEWKPGKLPDQVLPEVSLPEKFTEKVITMPEAAQLHFYMGHVGVRRTNPDYYKLLVMDYILGTGPGFTDRMSSRLRDREGLAYTVNANITGSAGKEPGRFACYIGTDRENYAKVKRLFLEELNRIRDTKPGDEELADAKTYLMGSGLLQFGTNSGIARQLLSIERYKLGLDYLENLRPPLQQ
jgi:zinc protease